MIVRITWKRAALAVVALAALGMAVAWAGLVPIAASSGHWKITDWFLHWTMQNSARTYSALQTPERVRDDDGLVSAAGHFHQSCQICHGAPGVPPSPVMQAATPPAPDLARTAGHYTDRELFWIVRHGIKYTGMPAWPKAGHDDEVRRMVGFVRRLPTMTAAQYAELTGEATMSGAAERADGAAPGGAVARCLGCHGADGMGRSQRDMPVLAGQKAEYLLGALEKYARGKGSSAIMNTAAAGLSRRDMQAAARYFAALPGLRRDAVLSGHPLIERGLPARQLPACKSCHAPGKAAPALAGQRASYVAERLTHWRGEETEVDARKPQDTMPALARRIPERELDALAKAITRSPPCE